MTSKRMVASVLFCGFCLLSAATGAWAQEAVPRAPGGAKAGARRGANANLPALTPVELERVFDSYVLLQAQDALKLTDGQFGRLLPALRALQAVRRRHAQSRRQLLNGMAGLLKTTPVDESAVRDRLKGLRDLDTRSGDELQKACDAVDEVLDPPQQARFRLFEDQVERRKIDLLMKARQRAAEQRRD
jgi:hypothetical protein